MCTVDGKGSTVHMMLFDFRKAFDLIDHAILMAKLAIMSSHLGCWTGLRSFSLIGSNE